jgi:ferredoxin
MSVAVDDRCTACGACLATCPTQALLPAPLRPVVVAARCTGCLECVEICPRAALTEVP